MAKLSYTWFPKDWTHSDGVFELTLSERGFYRELIDIAMLKDNKTPVKIGLWARRYNSTVKEIKGIIDTLKGQELIEIKDDFLFIPSCEKRLKLSRGGRKGGKKSKPTERSILNLKGSRTESPNESLTETKVKESKVKEKQTNKGVLIFPFNTDSFLALWAEWIDYKKVQHRFKYKSAKSEQLALNSLAKHGATNEQEARQIIESSMANGWAGLFDLKKTSVPKGQTLPNFR